MLGVSLLIFTLLEHLGSVTRAKALRRAGMLPGMATIRAERAFD